ncbi:MAG: PorV/PorQ family protein [bacterium]
MKNNLRSCGCLLIGWAVLTCLAGDLLGQDYNGALEKIFFGRQPSAKAEAMGRSLVATSADAFSAFYNPASTSLKPGWLISASYAGPYYLADKADYTFIGATYHFGNLGVLGLQLFRFSFGEPLFVTDINDPNAQSEKMTPTTSLYSLNYSRETIKDFYVGINFNLVRDKLVDTANSYLIDVGLLKIFRFHQRHSSVKSVSLGASLFNVSNSKMVSDFGPDRKITEILPRTLHVGAACQFFWGRSQLNSVELQTFGLLLHVAYQDLLNSKYLNGFQTGAELSFLQLLFVRLGYYRTDQDDFGFSDTNKNHLSDFTYGFGIALPVSKLTKKNIPLNVQFDMTSLKQPSFIKNYDKWANFSVFNLSINWQFNK